ncbi:MAG: FtsX-like permease family protein [Clostridiales bacterium]|nr:FtsX-like permease family protein [Clostridiales bacterium]
MNIALYIARRLSLGRYDAESGVTERRSPAVAIAITGISLSIVIMLLTLAIVPGFKHQVTRKVMGFDAQVTMHPTQPTAGYDGQRGLPVTYTPALESKIESCLPKGAVAEPAIRVPGILKTDDQFSGLIFKAYSTQGKALDFLSENLEEGGIPDYDECVDSTRYDIVISRTTANNLGLTLGQRVDGFFFGNDNLRARKFRVAGIYNSYFNEYDKLQAFMSPDAARRLASLGDRQCDMIEIRGLAVDEIPSVRESLVKVASETFHDGSADCYLAVNDVYELDPMYFNWLDLLDTNVVVILSLMACVAAVTLISCLFIMILERVRLIGTLKALGADNAHVAGIFLYMAERVVLRGILIGDIVGLALVWLQWRFNLLPLDPESYYLSSVPVEFNWNGIIVLNVAAVIISLLIMVLPTHIVARISPSRVMRFE